MDLHVYRNSQDRWHDLRAAARMRGAVLATNAVTLEELARRVTPDSVVATPGQRLALIGLATAGTLPVRYALDAVTELKAAGVKPADLKKAGNSDLAEVLGSYERLLSSHCLIDPQDQFWLAASRLAESHPAARWLSRFEAVVLHALYDLNEGQYALMHNVIEKLPGGGTVVLFNATANIKPTQFAEWTWKRFVQDEQLADKTFPEFVRSSGPLRNLLERLFVFEPPGPGAEACLGPGESLRILQCSGRYGEIESIGSEVADLLSKGEDPNEIAVVVRHVDTYGEMIEDVFARYEIPHLFSTGVPLLRIPFIKYWISLLDLVTGDRSRDAFARILSSAYYYPRLTPALDPEKLLAQIGYIDRGHLKASALASRHNSPLAPELERFELLLDAVEKASCRPLEFLERLQPPATLTERDRQAWRILVEEIEALDPLVGQVDFGRFRHFASEIAGLRTIDRFSEKLTAPGIPLVRVISPAALGYRSYRFLFAPGFADGEIPAPAARNPVLPDGAIDAINKAIFPRRLMNSRDRNRREPLQLFMVLDSATARVTLTCPGSSLDGEPIYPSIYVGEILRHYDPEPIDRAGMVRPREIGECFRQAARAWRDGVISEVHAESLLGPDLVRRVNAEKRGIGRADLGVGALPIDVEWSPSELNALATCPFVFLAKHRLRIRPMELPDFEVSPLDVGNLAHEILREFYAEPVSESEPAMVQRMQEIIGRRLAPVDVSGRGPSTVIDPSLWKIRRPQLVRALLEYVRFAVRDARAGYETLPEYLDQPLPAAPLGRALLKGRPDHIAARRTDGRLTGIRIDDFKYSASSSGLNKQLQQSFQIPVYAHLAAVKLNAEPGVAMEGRYLLLRSPSTPVVAQTVDAALIDEVRERIDVLIEKVHAGRLHPDPAEIPDCTFCDYRRLCRMYGG